jgi:nucleotide-binding universal stress UspA family protein
VLHTYRGCPGFVDGGVNFEEIDSASQAGARERAEEGTRRAERAGLKAQPSVRVREARIAEAAAVDARAIVMGTRGLTGVKSLLLGSVSHAVLQHADRAVVVVPSPEVARERGHHR